MAAEFVIVRPDGFVAWRATDASTASKATMTALLSSLLCRGAALRFLLTRLVDWLDVPPGALVQPKDPREYARKLRFHQKIKSPRDYGVVAP